jgi:hypothetical protein
MIGLRIIFNIFFLLFIFNKFSKLFIVQFIYLKELEKKTKKKKPILDRTILRFVV